MGAHFTKLVKAGDRLREFNFRKLQSNANDLFHVDVSDDRGNRIIFKMQKQEGNWKIADQEIPQWVQSAEAKLGDAIEDGIQ